MLQTAMEVDQHYTDRDQLMSLITNDMRGMSTESDQIGRLFAMSHDVRPTDFRALLHIFVAESAGRPITSGDLSQRMGLSGASERRATKFSRSRGSPTLSLRIG